MLLLKSVLFAFVHATTADVYVSTPLKALPLSPPLPALAHIQSGKREFELIEQIITIIKKEFHFVRFQFWPFRLRNFDIKKAYTMQTYLYNNI